MAPTSTFEYVSPEWLEAVESIIVDLLKGHDLDSLDYCICEDLTNPPAGRADTSTGTLSWFIRIRLGELHVGSGSVDDADIRITADYTTHHELSRRVWADDPEAIAAARRHRQIAAADGRLRIDGDPSAAPLLVRELVARLHDPVAAITT
ncbi:SCP2 sterol-binding domain-containing protein [Nocardia sp. alder85J]|uniref:SCP2 sterol-binding domain-containing protein n=1 Tax=Nocardia sp. alder85J TaxID=2862949 RepID=UPI001CD7B727|nr:SCP2 sterol-binding domain-containing protein [Nocardia sp. alder85J]MCX4095023.1 SCP2 sterol-binding domain-containing protein [Nocardia sp. alder85J]